MRLSLADQIADALPTDPEERRAAVALMDPELLAGLRRRDWQLIARPDQLEPQGQWFVWWLSGGRGSGKGMTGSHTEARWVVENPMDDAGVPTEWACVGPTFGHARDVMVEGPTGLIRAFARMGYERGRDYRWNRSHGTIDLATGQRIHSFGADDEDAGRGLNLAGLWGDETGMWRYAERTWMEALAPALRVRAPGWRPRSVHTSTPKPRPLLRDWEQRQDGSVVVTRVSTFDNAPNLPPEVLAELRKRYEGTRIGRQELYGELIDDVEGALWTWLMIAPYRIDRAPSALLRTVVAVDPAFTHHADSDETGIVACGMDADRHYYALADRSGRYAPLEWANKVVNLYDELGADRIVVENVAHDLVVANLANVRAGLPVQMVRAGTSKKRRAQPVAALYEQHRVHHVGELPVLEEQLVSWVPDQGQDSPDRLDALVYALTDLAPKPGGVADRIFESMTQECWKCGRRTRKDQTCEHCGAELRPGDRTDPMRRTGTPDLSTVQIGRVAKP